MTNRKIKIVKAKDIQKPVTPAQTPDRKPANTWVLDTLADIQTRKVNDLRSVFGITLAN